MKTNPSASVQRLFYLAPLIDICQMIGEQGFLFASGDDWGEIPPIEGDDDDDF